MASNEAMQEEESSIGNELELGLALTLGGASHLNNNNKNNSSWGHELYGRILTAKDFPNGFSSSSSTTRRPSSDHSDSSTPIVSSQVVGWPPIRAYRMNTLVSQAKTQDTKVIAGNHDDNNVEESKDMILCNKNVNDKTTSSTHIGFVKVNMDGMPIGRKVNLKAHECYDALANTVEDMFFNSNNINSSSSSFMNGDKKKPVKLLDSSSEFVLTYEDRDGDWMLLGDVPWGMFISNVKKLRIMRTFEANGLSTPKLQARK